MIRKTTTFLAGVMLALSSLQAGAVTVIGGYSFADNAFVDSLVGAGGSFSGNAPLISAVTDSNADTYAYGTVTGAYLDLAFNDNNLVNGAGADLVLFELGDADTIGLTIGGTTINYLPVSTGTTTPSGFTLNAAAIDLSDFGITAGTQVNSFRLEMYLNGPDFSLAGALNTAVVPVPAAVWLFGSGLLGLAGVARRRKA